MHALARVIRAAVMHYFEADYSHRSSDLSPFEVILILFLAFRIYFRYMRTLIGGTKIVVSVCSLEVYGLPALVTEIFLRIISAGDNRFLAPGA